MPHFPLSRFQRWSLATHGLGKGGIVVPGGESTVKFPHPGYDVVSSSMSDRFDSYQCCCTLSICAKSGCIT